MRLQVSLSVIQDAKSNAGQDPVTSESTASSDAGSNAHVDGATTADAGDHAHNDQDAHDSHDGAAHSTGEQAHDSTAHASTDHTDAGHEEHTEAASQDGYTPAEGMEVYMDAGHLFAHVQDSYYFEVPRFLSPGKQDEHGHWVVEPGKVPIPNITGATVEKPLVPALGIVGRPTKYMCLELLAAILIVAAFTWLAGKVRRTGEAPKGRLWNFLESIVCFVRDEIARPTIGKADADRFLPFLLTLFFFIIVLNLLGMIPFMGSPTAALAVTGVLAVITFLVVVGSGMRRLGVIGFLKAQVPHMELSPALALVLVPSIWLIEMFGLFVKHFVLAIRLFANMFAGHLVLAVFLGFIGVTWGSALVYGVAPIVVLVSIALSVLELFVACLQAYVFTFLAALFIGAALHPH